MPNLSGDVEVVEKPQQHIHVVHVAFRDLRKMARLLLIVKILPTGTEVDLEKLVEGIKSNLKDGNELVRHQKLSLIHI